MTAEFEKVLKETMILGLGGAAHIAVNDLALTKEEFRIAADVVFEYLEKKRLEGKRE
jgi:hypothetical protein